jgi:hypothetical protein
VSRVVLSRADGEGSPTHLREGFLAALGMTLVATAAYACPVCYGGPSAGGRGMNAAIIFLLAIVGCVQIGIAALFFGFWKRARNVIERGAP